MVVFLHSDDESESDNERENRRYGLRARVMSVNKKRKKQPCHVGYDKHDGKHKKAKVSLFWSGTASGQSTFEMRIFDGVG